MSIRRDDLSPGQKTLRSLGMTVIAVTGLFAAGIAWSYLFGGQGSGWKQVASAAGLAAAAVALFAMLADTVDYWMLGRRMTPFSLKMTRSLIFIAMLVAVVLSVAGSTPLFFLLMTPALMIYLFGVVRRRPEPIRRPSDAPARRRSGAVSQSRSSGAPRQKRGGKKRK
jgi:O-antigen/teichoic acid export membrane protein